MLLQEKSGNPVPQLSRKFGAKILSPFSTNRGIALPSKSARDAQTKNFPKLPKAFRVGLKKFSRG
jgi:hypothetical protein